MPLKGERIDKPSYAILRSIQGGAAGEVYEAKHLVFGKKCVQKTYSTVGLEDAAAHGEPRLLYEIKHPRVAEVLEAQYDPDVKDAITFVTVFYEGRCIATAFDEDYRFSIHQAIGIIVDVLDALSYVHNDRDLRVIHRDVKPGNVFLEADRRNARLGDWGSAARIDEDGTVAGIEGSPLYVPPEAGPPDGAMDVTGDVYGAAITIFEMLNGPFPYAEIDPQVVDRRLTRGWKALPESAFQFAPHIPAPLRSVVAKGMRSDPRSRWQSGSAFISALQRVECIDWIHADGEGLDGRWVGSWPPSKPSHNRRRYEVTSTTLTGGAYRGKRRLTARQALPGSDRFARFGIEDETVAADDRGAMERFFSAVEARAAQRSPVR
jgi:eukaryotic-like serine/threonine-protein kinase